MSSLKNKSIIVFTGGGLAPALNATLYGVISRAKAEKMKVLGGMNGWASMIGKSKIVDLTRININPIKYRGGTFLRSSRTNPLADKNGIKKVKATLKKYNIDYIVAIGGDDTLGAADNLFKKENISIVGIPKTIDNDLAGTYFTPGFPSAASKLIEIVKNLKRDASYALNRIFVVESLGHKAGWLASSSYYGGADVMIPPEKKNSLDKTLKIIKECYEKNKKSAVVVIGKEAKFDKKIAGLEDYQKDPQYKQERQLFISLALYQFIRETLYKAEIRLKSMRILHTG